jgi:elongation factor Tu
VRVTLQLASKDDGGRHTPVFAGYRPDFRAATDGHGDLQLGAATATFPEGTAMLMPGMSLDVELEPVDAAAWANVSTGLVLGVFEGDQQVGTATVLAR